MHSTLLDVALHVDPPAGEGEPVVLVHGAWTDHATWAGVVDPLARSFRVISYDRRGHSRSPRGALPPARQRHEDDLAELIERLGIAPAHIAGAGHTPHHTHPAVLAAIVEEHARG